MKKLIVLFAALVLLGCTKTETNSISNKVSFKTPSTQNIVINNQNFNIIPTYEYYLDYIEDQNSNKTNKERSFQEHVLGPISTDIYGNGVSLNGYHYFNTPKDTPELSEFIHELIERHPDIINYITEALEMASNILPGKDYEIYLIPYNPNDITSTDMEGKTGFADEGFIVIQIDPYKFTKESLQQTIVHEYHHVVYIDVSDYQIRRHNLLDRVMMEGKAEVFTKTFFSDYDPIWLEPLSPESMEIVWNYLVENKDSINPDDWNNMFLGNYSKGLPTGSVYKIGVKIMESYLRKNSHLSIEEWMLMPADEIIEKVELEGLK